jgi:hypothetical protein
VDNGGLTVTLSQRNRKRAERIDWLSAWSSWDGEYYCVFVHVTEKYIYFALGCTPNDPPHMTYCVERGRWEHLTRMDTEEMGGNGYGKKEQSIIVENETFFCRRKCAEKIDQIAAIVERGRKEIVGSDRTRIEHAMQDWASGAAYLDNGGNYRLKGENSRRGKIAPWNKTAKRTFPSALELHRACAEAA